MKPQNEHAQAEIDAQAQAEQKERQARSHASKTRKSEPNYTKRGYELYQISRPIRLLNSVKPTPQHC